MLAEFPRAGRIVPEVGMEPVREIIFERYRIVHAVRGDSVFVLTVLHGAMDARTRLGELVGES